MASDQDFFTYVRFTDGKLLRAADLEAQRKYEDGKRRLLSRTFFGWGVVYGLRPERSGDKITLSPGLALEKNGHEICVPAQAAAPLSELLAGAAPQPGTWRLCLESDEQPDGWTELTLPDPQDPENVPHRITEGYRLELRREAGESGVCVALVQIEWRDGWRIASLTPCGAFSPARPQTKPAPPGGEARGDVLFDLQRRPGPGGVYYSREISHGLGPGDVLVTAAIRGWQEGRECLLTGDASLFGTEVRCAVKAYPERGTFVLAVRCREAVSRHLRLTWTARRAAPAGEPVSAIPARPAAPVLTLEPADAVVGPGQRIQFRLLLDAKPWEGSCILRVCEAGGGAFEDGGWYTAPYKAGTYKIAALQPGSRDELAAAYVHVRPGKDAR